MPSPDVNRHSNNPVKEISLKPQQKRIMTARLIVFLLTCVCCRSIAIENPTFPGGLREIEFNSAKWTVQITLGALLHTVHGTFKLKDATVRFDPASGRASGQIEVDVKSGATGESARDRQMHDNVLESNRFPEAVFSPDRVKGRLAPRGESEVEVHGSLRIHGEEHEMTILRQGQCGKRPGDG
jgi:polyisoprenoid-binding protein YceI